MKRRKGAGSFRAVPFEQAWARSRTERESGEDTEMRWGQAMVEFAVIVPILCLLLIGAVQFGIIVQQYIAVVHFSREVARYAALNAGKTDDQISSAMASRVPASLVKSKLTYSFDPSYTGGTLPEARYTGNPIAVGLHYDLSGRIFLPTSFFGWQIPTTLPRYTVTMRIEQD